MNIENFKVSLIINVYNAEKLITPFLTSLTKLTYKDFELIIVDDGSTDNTLLFIEQFRDNFNLKIFSLNHQGLCAARSFGFQEAHGEICIIFDVDEEILDDQIIEKFIEPFEDESVGGVGGNKYPIGDGWLYEAHRLDRKARQYLRKQKGKKYAKFLMGGVLALRRKLVLDLGGLSKSDTIVEDTDISIRLRRAGWKLIISDNILVGHPDPETIRGTFRRAIIQGTRIINLAIKYPRDVINFTLLFAYFPFWTVLIGLYKWLFGFVVIILSFILTQIFFKFVKTSSVKTRTYVWLLFWINGLGISLGSFIGVINYIKNSFQKNNIKNA